MLTVLAKSSFRLSLMLVLCFNSVVAATIPNFLPYAVYFESVTSTDGINNSYYDHVQIADEGRLNRAYQYSTTFYRGPQNPSTIDLLGQTTILTTPLILPGTGSFTAYPMLHSFAEVDQSGPASDGLTYAGVETRTNAIYFMDIVPLGGGSASTPVDVHVTAHAQAGVSSSTDARAGAIAYARFSQSTEYFDLVYVQTITQGRLTESDDFDQILHLATNVVYTIDMSTIANAYGVYAPGITSEASADVDPTFELTPEEQSQYSIQLSPDIEAAADVPEPSTIALVSSCVFLFVIRAGLRNRLRHLLGLHSARVKPVA